MSDADYARRLQEEYRREFMQRRASAPVEDDVMPRSSAYVPMPPPPPPVAPRVAFAEPSSAPFAPSPVLPVYSNTDFFAHFPNNTDNADAQAMDDEAYARRLQLEMEEADRLMEEARRCSQTSRRYEITPVSNVHQPFDEVELECHYHHEDEDRRLAQQAQDEELARQLAAKPPTPQHHAHHHSRRAPSRTHSSSRHRSSSSNRHSHSTDRHWDEPVAFQHVPSKPLTASTASDSSDEMARRIAQEMDDAEMAQRLSLYEQETLAQQARQTGRKRSLSYLCLTRIFPLLFCGSVIAVALLFILGVFDPQNVPFIGDKLGGNGWIDPFKGDVAAPDGNNGSVPIVAQDQARWSTDGQEGISLEIVNACEDKWTDFLNTAVQNWDNGFPLDPLTLSISRASYDPVCEAITGKIKVCNADYGDTRWRGLNELMLNKQTNTIVSSTAKMNEFYLSTESDDQKLYTMCHEMGHGFGLPHWDEDFFNEDMGTCMDYTNNPGANKKPDASNFLFLAQIYGGVNITTGQAVPASAVMSGDEEGPRTSNTDTDTGTGTSAQDTPQGGGRRSRMLWGKSMVDSAIAITNLRSVSSSQVILSEPEQRRRRRILIANDFFEVHQVMDVNEDLVRLQIYLLA